MSQITSIINRFDGGIAEDHRVKSSNKFALTKHFDVFTYPHKLVPHYKTEADETKVYNITRFLYAPGPSSGFRLWGYGSPDPDPNEKAAIYRYDIDSNFTGGWDLNGNGSISISDTNAKLPNTFLYYKGFIFFFANRYLQAFDTTEVAVVNENVYDKGSAISTDAQGLVHPNDDTAYFFHDNIVVKVDNDTPTGTAVLTLPSDLKIVASCAYGNYVAIGCVTKSDSVSKVDSKSVVFLWDRDSSLTTLTDRIELGRGELMHIANLNNRLTIVINAFSEGTVGLNKGKFLIKQYNGQGAIQVNEITTDARIDVSNSPSPYTPLVNFVKENKLYFPMRADLDADGRNGIWVVDSNGNITLDIIEAEVTDIGTIEGIYATGNMWWIAHSQDGSINRTDDAAAYSTTNPSIYESLINLGDSRLTNDLVKKLIGVSVMTEPLPSAGQVVLKYRTSIIPIASTALVAGNKYIIKTVGNTDWTAVGAASSAVGVEFTATGTVAGTGKAISDWTTIFTNTTDDSIVHEAINISGATLPEFREIQFRIESLGGAIITGLKMKVATIDKSLY